MTEKSEHSIRFTDLVAGLPSTVPFVGAETQERARGKPFAARIGANENVFGPSRKVCAAMAAAAPDIWKYGDSESYDLKQALAAHHGIAAENIMVGEGVDGLLGYLVRMFVAAGDAVVTSLGGYPTFNFHVAGYGGDLHTVPYRGDYEDAAGLIDLSRILRPKLVYLANPDNPMGTVLRAEAVQSMIDAVPDGTLMVLDEAYIEFAPEGTAPLLDTDDRRVVRMRTFSKAYGMAGARVGYAIGQREVIAGFDKIRNHFGMNRMAQAGAIAALADQVHLRDTVAKVAAARDRIAAIAAANGLSSVQSATNFVAVDCGHDGAFAKRVLDGLVARDVFVRMPFVAPQNRCIRISAGLPEHLDLLEKVLPEALADAAS
jgi:histidinol-phosphate aminotransferase